MSGSEIEKGFVKYLGSNPPRKATGSEYRLTIPDTPFKTRLLTEQPGEIYWAVKQVGWADQEEFIVASFNQMDLGKKDGYDYPKSLPPKTEPTYKGNHVNIRLSKKIPGIENLIENVIEKEKSLHILFNSEDNEYYFVSDHQIQKIRIQMWDPSPENKNRLKRDFSDISSKVGNINSGATTGDQKDIGSTKQSDQKSALFQTSRRRLLLMVGTSVAILGGSSGAIAWYSSQNKPLLENPNFEQDLSRWTVQDPTGTEQQPGRVVHSPNIARMIVNGAHQRSI